MMPRGSTIQRPDAHHIAAEIIRRARNEDGRPRYVVRLSDPPTATEQLQLMAARLSGQPIAIMPHKSKTVGEGLGSHRNL